MGIHLCRPFTCCICATCMCVHHLVKIIKYRFFLGLLIKVHRLITKCFNVKYGIYIIIDYKFTFWFCYEVYSLTLYIGSVSQVRLVNFLWRFTKRTHDKFEENIKKLQHGSNTVTFIGLSKIETSLWTKDSRTTIVRFYQLTAGGAPSLLGPPFDGGSALFRSFRRRSDAGRIMYNITAKIINSIIMKKLSLAPWFGALGKSKHSLSVQ